MGHTAIKPASLVVSVHENYVRSENDPADEPDDLSFGVPHKKMSRELRFGVQLQAVFILKPARSQ